MAMIVTTYGKDGTKTRKAVGYAGGQCNVATAPYEQREISGQTKKTPTGEACLPEPTEAIEQQQQVSN